MNKKIKSLIKKYASKRSFSYNPITVEQVKEAEKTLGIKLPSQYLEFLKEYGYGGIGGIEILGVGADDSLIFVEETLDYREYGLPKNYIVVEDCGEWVYCINADDETIISWSKDLTKEEFEDFDSFLLDRFEDAAENL